MFLEGEIYVKKWYNPEMEVFSVKLDENIAASGDAGTGNYSEGFIYYDLGGITRGGANYRWNSLNQIQDTQIAFHIVGGQKAVGKDYVSQISGCLV